MSAGAIQDGGQTSIGSIVDRLTVFIEHETEELKSQRRYDFQSSSERKSRMLFELSRASRATDPASLDQEITEALVNLKAALKKNEAGLLAHLSAVREVSSIMVGILRNEEADGTYGDHF